MQINRLRQILSGLCALGVTLVITSSAFAQGTTTAEISGIVKDKQGNPVVAASVTAIATDTGGRTSTVTRSNGQYSIDGLSIGVTYAVAVSGSGFANQEKPGYVLNAGDNVKVDFVVSSEVVQMEAVNVGATQDTTFDSTSTGTKIVLNAQQVEGVVSRTGDLADLMNLDPRVAEMQAGTSDQENIVSAQGFNPKENLLLADGVSITDNFGLNSNSYAGLRNPIPFPWIASFTQSLDLYDVVYSGYSGLVDDITLKSGTNEFHGELYGEYSGTNFRGPDPAPGLLGAHEAVQDHTTGATLGGPIIKDKLFFFVGYEAFREITAPPAQVFNPEDNATDATTINQILAQAQADGYTPGSFNATNHIWQQNFVGKLDWNINDAQKFEFTFRHTAGQAPIFYDYASTSETSLTSSWYNSFRTDQSYTAKLNSDWSSFIPGLSTEIEATYVRYNGTASYEGPDLPALTIESLDGTNTTVSGTTATTTGKLFLGRYYAYQLNNIYTWEQEQHAYATYAVGDHTFKFGVVFDRTSYTDTFIPNYLGSYYFANAQDFTGIAPGGTTATTAPNQPTYANIETPNGTGYTLGSDVSHYYLLDIAPMVQDTWNPNSALTVTAGVRMDDPYDPQNPPYSTIFANTWGFANNTTMSGNYTVAPRLSFNYKLPTESLTQIRGGGGLILGTNPVVWVENSYNNAGQLANFSTGSSSATAKPATLPFPFDPTGTPPNVPVGSAVPGFDVTSPSFHWPANWKENLAIDHELPWWNLVFTAELNLTQVQQDAMYQELNLATAAQNGESGPAFMPDGAIRYAGNITSTLSGDTLVSSGYSTSYGTVPLHSQTGQVYELANTNKGGSQEYTLEITRPLKDNWDLTVAYTHTHATAVQDLSSSVASSNFEDELFLNPNDQKAYRSAYDVPDKFVIATSRQFHFFPWKNSATLISAQFIAQTGQPYSYTFYGDADGTGADDQSLFYVPTGPNDPKVTWSSATEEANFFTWLANNPALAKYAGQVAPRNAFYSAWQHTVNLHLEQQVGGYGEARVTVFADCFNFANLLNKNWGLVANYDPDFQQVDVAGTDYLPNGNGGQGQYVYRFNSTTLDPTNAATSYYSDLSRWAISVGAKIEF